MSVKKYNRLANNIDHLKSICKLKTNKCRNNYVAEANDDLIACLVECAANILRGNVRLKPKYKKSLKKHKTFLRNIGKERRVPLARAKLMQSGGFLPILISPVLAAIATTAVSELIAKLT